MIHTRVTPGELAELDRRCEAAGMTRAAYIRRLLSLPVDFAPDPMTISPADGTSLGPGDARGGLPAASGERRPSEQVSVPTDHPDARPDGSGHPRERLLLTDAALVRLRVAIDRWGVNYNQAVHAINIVAAEYTSGWRLDDDELEEVRVLLRACAVGAERAWRGIKMVHEDIASYLPPDPVDIRGTAGAAPSPRRRRAGSRAGGE